MAVEYGISKETLYTDSRLFSAAGRVLVMTDLREKRRLIEAGHLRAWRRQGRSSLHLENIRALHPVLRTTLRLAGLLKRGRQNALDPRLRTVRFEFPSLPASFDGFRILHLSDIHADALEGLGEAVCARLRDVEADLCVLTGDYRFDVEGSCDAVYPRMERILGCVRAPHGILGVLGNHDLAEKVAHLERMGAKILMNECVEIRRGRDALWVAGVDDPHYYGCDDLARAVAGTPAGAFTILLAHSPELYAEAAARGIDLYLCGHTHAGQICLPGGTPILVHANCPRRLTRGAWRHRDLQGYTSAGVGSSFLPVRFNCPPEIVLVELRKQRLQLES